MSIRDSSTGVRTRARDHGVQRLGAPALRARRLASRSRLEIHVMIHSHREFAARAFLSLRALLVRSFLPSFASIVRVPALHSPFPFPRSRVSASSKFALPSDSGASPRRPLRRLVARRPSAMVKLSPLCHRASAHDAEVWATCFAGDTTLVTGSLDESVKLWVNEEEKDCLLYTSPSPRDLSTSRMPSSA